MTFQATLGRFGLGSISKGLDGFTQSVIIWQLRSSWKSEIPQGEEFRRPAEAMDMCSVPPLIVNRVRSRPPGLTT